MFFFFFAVQIKFFYNYIDRFLMFFEDIIWPKNDRRRLATLSFQLAQTARIHTQPWISTNGHCYICYTLWFRTDTCHNCTTDWMTIFENFAVGQSASSLHPFVTLPYVIWLKKKCLSLTNTDTQHTYRQARDHIFLSLPSHFIDIQT